MPWRECSKADKRLRASHPLEVDEWRARRRKQRLEVAAPIELFRMPHLAIRDALETIPSGSLLCRRSLHFHPRLSLEPAFDP